MDHSIVRGEIPESFSQVRPKSGDGSPLWYSPNRDLLHQFPAWISGALRRFDGVGLPDKQAGLGEECRELARLFNDLCAGELAGKPEEMESRIRSLLENPAAYRAVGGVVLTHLLWMFWQFAGEVSLRQEGPIKL